MLDFFRSLATDIAAALSGVVLLFTGAPSTPPELAAPSQPQQPEVTESRQPQNPAIQAAAEMNRQLAQQQPTTTRSVGPVPSQPQPIQQNITEPIVETRVTGGIDESTLTARLSSLANDLRLELAQQLASLPRTTTGGGGGSTPITITSSSGPYVTLDQFSRQIDAIGESLLNVSESIPSLTDATIPDDITASNYLPLSGGTLTGDLSLSGTLTAGILNVAALSSQGALIGPYFQATSTMATSTFAGALDVAGTVNLATTTITGGLTVNGNTNITEGGELQVGDKIISPGEIGLGTTTPAAKLAIQSTDPNQTSLLIVGTTSQANPLLDIFNSNNTNLLRLTADGRLGIGSGNSIDGFPSDVDLAVGGTVIVNNTAPNLYLRVSSGSDNASLQFGNDLRFRTGAAVELARLTSSGNLGIGTTSPLARLSVKGAGTGTGLLAQFTDSANTPRLTVLDNGNVGIGIAAPGGPLDVQASGSDIAIFRGSGGATVRVLDGSSVRASSDLFLDTISGTGGNIQLRPRTATALTVTTAGNVGIGTTSPSQKLHVAGGLRLEGGFFDSANTSGMSGMVLTSTGSGTAWTATSSLGLGGGSSNWTDNGTYLSPLTSTDGILVNASSTFADRLNLVGLLNFATTTGPTLALFNSAPFITASSSANNVSLGERALDSVTNGAQNIAFGTDALTTNSTGSNNVALGYQALVSNTSGASNVAIGYQALWANGDGDNNVAIGHGALDTNTSGDNNIAIGLASLTANTTGSNNLALGLNALAANTEGYQNTAIGVGALSGITTSGENTALGYNAGNNLTTGFRNIIIGYDIDAPSATANQQLNIGNLIFGTSLGGTGTTISSGNIGIGTTSPSEKLSVSGGNIRVENSVGVPSVKVNNTSGLAVALAAGFTSTVFAYDSSGVFAIQARTKSQILSDSYDPINNRLVVTGAGNVGIGTTTPPSTLTVAGTVTFDGLTLNTGAAVASLCLSSANEVTRNTDNESCITSSERYKKNIETLLASTSIETLLALRPVSFEYKEQPGERYGLIAEEVDAVDTTLVGYDDEGRPNSVRYTSIIPLLIDGFKDLWSKVIALIDSDEQQAAEIATLKARVAELEARAGISTPSQTAAAAAAAAAPAGSQAATDGPSAPNSTEPPIIPPSQDTATTTPLESQGPLTGQAAATSSPAAANDNGISEGTAETEETEAETEAAPEPEATPTLPNAANDNEPLSDELPATGTQ